MTRYIQIGKFGLKENPVNYQVAFEYQGRTLLGDVKDYYREEVTGSIKLKVNYFCGKPWPLDPVACLVEVLS